MPSAANVKPIRVAPGRAAIAHTESTRPNPAMIPKNPPAYRLARSTDQPISPRAKSTTPTGVAKTAS